MPQQFESGLTSPRRRLTGEPEEERFGRMTFRSHRINEFEIEQNRQSKVSLAGIIKLQSTRRKTNRSWRPMQASDLGESGSISGDGNLQLTDAHGLHDALTQCDFQDPFIDLQSRLSALSNATSAHAHLGDVYDVTGNVESVAVFNSAEDICNGQVEALSTTEATRVRLFGTLPDPIRLSEQMGKFDGQIVFIGHPNLDISAHQWSSSSFEWVNIGRYSHSQGRMEGSLASDRLRGLGEPEHSIERFKLAAENRQALVIEKGRLDNKTFTAGPALCASMDAVGQTQDQQDPSTQDFHVADKVQSREVSSFPSTAHTLLTKDVLEDPFVGAAGVSLSQDRYGSKLSNNVVNSAGSLDLTYRFPTKESSDIAPTVGSRSFTFSNMGGASGLSTASRVQGVPFGEEAATRRRSSLVQNGRFQQLPLNTPRQPFQDHSQIPIRAGESSLSLPWHKDLALDADVPIPSARLTTQTRSVLSAKCTTSNLSATAASYSQAPTRPGTSRSSSSASTVHVGGVALHYSDPDGLRKTQQYEVANGLTQQAPTAQSFQGPFFTDSKPTTQDLTAALSVHVSEEEKLVKWFRDGCRPGRQREYTKSLIAAAMASDKNRYFGVIGEVSVKSEDGPYANTGPFVRLYENLSEYVEERGEGGSPSYFTRQWKPTAPQSRSYLGKGNGRPSWPGAGFSRPADRMWG